VFLLFTQIDSNNFSTLAEVAVIFSAA